MKKTYILFFGLLFCGICNIKGQKTELALNLQLGKIYKQITNVNSNVEQDLGGQKMAMKMTIIGEMSFLVKSANESNYDLEVKYDRLSMEMQTPQGNMMFSSEIDNEQDIFSLILGEMKGKAFYVKMAKNGTVEEVSEIENVFESAFSRFDQLSPEQIAQIKAQLMKSYGEEAFKGNLEMVTAIFPDEPVALNEKWIINTKLESGMSANLKTTYQYTGKSGDFNTIKGSSELATSDKDAYVQANGMDMKYDLSGTMQSDIKIDQSTGWIVEANIEQNVKGDAYIKANAQIPDGMKIPMSFTTMMIISNK